MVKTEASHAFNIGSNPVRVTTDSLFSCHVRFATRGKKIPHLAMANALPDSHGSRKVLDKRPAIAYDIVCSRNAVPIVGAD